MTARRGVRAQALRVQAPLRTLSVSINASVSPGLSSSPTFFVHDETVPEVIVGESAGIGSFECAGKDAKARTGQAACI